MAALMHVACASGSEAREVHLSYLCMPEKLEGVTHLECLKQKIVMRRTKKELKVRSWARQAPACLPCWPCWRRRQPACPLPPPSLGCRRVLGGTSS